MRTYVTIALALALAFVAGLGFARTAAAAYNCDQCRSKCQGLPFGRGLCMEGCKTICKVANTVKDKVEQIAQKVIKVAGQAITLIRTAYNTAEQLWSQIKNLRMPLVARWSANVRRVDLRSRFASFGIAVKKQFNSTCMAHALSSALEYATIPYLLAQPELAKRLLGGKRAQDFRVSRHHLYYLSRHGLQICKPAMNAKFGSWSLQAASWLVNKGTFEEKYWPFENWNPADVRAYGNCLAAATRGAPSKHALANRHYFIDQFFYLPGVPLPGKASVRRPSDIKGILARGYPVVITVFTFPEDLWDGARIRLPKKALTKPESAHYVLVVGFDDKRETFIIKNSWGTKWGDKGFGYLPYEYVRRYAIEGLFVRTPRVK